MNISKSRWQDWLTLLLGVWLFISPFFGLSALNGLAAWNAHIGGLVIAILASIALVRPELLEEWFNLCVGIWLIIAPFVLGYAEVAGAMWNHIGVGILVGADALWVIYRKPEKPMRDSA